MLDTLSQALQWSDSHGLTLPVILGAITVLARLAWAALRPFVARRWPTAVPVVEGAAVRVAALLPDVLAAILRRRPAAPSGRSGEAGRATVGALVVLAAAGLVASVACRPVREAIIDAQSPRVACVGGSHRCAAGAPEVCSAAGRWWPAMPPRDDGSPRVCAGACVLSDAGIAHCAAVPQ